MAVDLDPGVLLLRRDRSENVEEGFDDDACTLVKTVVNKQRKDKKRMEFRQSNERSVVLLVVLGARAVGRGSNQLGR